MVQLTNSSGTVTKNYTYDAFGVEKNAATSDANPFRYCGEQFDSETGNYYLRARYYSPGIGRFTQADTHWNPGNMIYGDDPQKWNEWQGEEDPLNLHAYTYKPEATAVAQAGNLYVYAHNNAIQFCDPHGLWTIAIGPNVAAAFGFGLTGGLQLAIDGHGNLVVLANGAAQAGTPNASWGGVISFSNAKTVFDLEGQTYSVGGSAGLGVSGGLEFAYGNARNGDAVTTVNISLGGGVVPIELHADFAAGTKVWLEIKWRVLRDWLFNQILGAAEDGYNTLSADEQKAIRDNIGTDWMR